MTVRVVVERGPKGRKSVAFAPDWPGWTRNGKTPELAVERLEAYRPRYRAVASAARLTAEFGAAGPFEVVEDRIGNASTDYWGISFLPCSLEVDPVPEDELARKLTLLRGCWKVFDTTGARVSADLRLGPRGGGWSRDQLIRHVIRNESEEMARRLGLRVPEMGAMSPDGLRTYRRDYLATMRAYNKGEGKRMRTWNLAFLIRHSAYHTMDHTWEMQDRDLTGLTG